MTVVRSGPTHGASQQLGFRVLGPLEVERSSELVSVGGPRQQRLLSLLLINNGRVVSTDQLIEEVWAGEPPDGADTTLRSYISRLRSALSAVAITGSASGYQIQVPVDSLDSVRFERLIREGDAALSRGELRRAADAHREALDLWRSRPFGDLGSDGALSVEADRLEELRLHALEQRIDAELMLGRGAEVVDEVESLVRQHPYRERLWRLLMLALYHSARQADALAAYQRARTMLDEHLGIDPTPELQALEGQILRQEVPALARTERRDNLPAPLNSFVGREAELTQIASLLAGHTLVTLTGVGGVGKTRLAIEAARRAAPLAPDGLLFIDLAPLRSEDVVAQAVERALELRDQAGVSAFDLITAELRHLRLMLVLDNCEHVRGSAAELADAIRTRCPEVRVLATSRVPLGSEGEVEFPVSPMGVPPESASAAELRSSEAVRLLVDRVAASRPLDLLNDRSWTEAARICRDLDGLPLAIELAAARAKAMTLREIAGRLDDRFRFLISWRRVTPARHQTLKQAIDWSYDLLPTDDQLVFARLAVFAGGFTLDGVAAVTTGSDEMRALDAVTRLVDASLVVADAAAGSSRYRMLETVRQYAQSRLADIGAEADARESHVAYFVGLAQRAEPELSGADQTKWFERLDAEHANFVVALDRLAQTDRDAEALLDFTVSLTRFWYVRGHLSEARASLERALAGSSSAPTLLRRRGLTAAASVALLQGDYSEATRFAEASLDAARDTGEERLIANGLSNLGAIVLAAGEHDRAAGLLREAVDLARKVGDTRILALALNNLGDHALTVADYERAEPLFAESLSLLEMRGDTANVARSLFNLGSVDLKLGRLADAETRLHASLEASRETGDQEDLCWGLLGLAAVAAARGAADRAALLLGAATNLLGRMGADFKPFERQLHAETEARVIELLGHDKYADARTRGGSLDLADAVEVATQS